MTVAAILKRKAYQVTIVESADRIGDVVQVMSAAQAEAALVVDDSGQLLGVLAEHDIVESLAANAARALEMTAGQLVTRAVRTVNSRTSLAEAARTMVRSRLRHLPVVEHGELVGLISLADLARARLIQEQAALAA
ncbi:MAG TPA: CBS domain-containing protein [Acetobacteraceae bacterium]|nr:CBS domain-containing protein [Acetobacteraceae bacterium]